VTAPHVVVYPPETAGRVSATVTAASSNVHATAGIIGEGSPAPGAVTVIRLREA
jgi:hypothetical protein